MFESVLNSSILGRARAQGILDIRCVDIRPFSDRKHKNTDDYPFGGGAGMVMLAQPILDAMHSVTGDDFQGRRIYLGPRGRTLSTAVARELAQERELVLLCGHYEGVDQRALDTCIDEEISIGDYILTGGELAAMVLTDCVARFIPGVLGSAESPEEESFPMGCWNIRSTRARANSTAWKCRMCCCPATTRKSRHGGALSPSARRSGTARIYWHPPN